MKLNFLSIFYYEVYTYWYNDLKYILTDEGRVMVNEGNTYDYQYFLKDHLGNTRVTFTETGEIIQEDAYYPEVYPDFNIGRMQMNGLCHETGTDFLNKNLYNGKELQDDFGLDWYDYGARFYDPALGRWHVIDNLSENSISITPYHYCINNPIAFIDPNGNDWFYYKEQGADEPKWHWQDGCSYNTGVKNNNGDDIILTGVQAVVVFEGSTNESLGEKNGKEGNINGEGANTANVTVYGPKGENDIKTYTGYTMSSDPDLFGKVKDGIYEGFYKDPGKKGKLKSNFALYGSIAAMGNENPAYPDQVDNNGNAYLIGVYIHRTNNNGFAGTYIKDGTTHGISEGCLLIPTNVKFHNRYSASYKTRHLPV
ncbi:MAG: hypothetical protein JEY97_16385 [Bacteroidales bacterium]|nr:hypothetical protein [Bacteroidales bacterium]